MADPAKVLIAILRGDYDGNLGDLAEALGQRQVDLTYVQKAAEVIAAYVELTEVSVEDVLASLEKDEE